MSQATISCGNSEPSTAPLTTAFLGRSGTNYVKSLLQRLADQLDDTEVTFEVTSLTLRREDISIKIEVLSKTYAPPSCSASFDAPPRSDISNLTPRELQVLMLLKLGASTTQIAERLSISRVTVRNHTQSIIEKLGVHSRLEAVVVALQAPIG